MNNFKTSDSELATVLLYSGCNFLESEMETSKRVSLVFEDEDKCEDIQKDYLSGRLGVEPIKFFGAMSNIKKIIFHELKQR